MRVRRVTQSEIDVVGIIAIAKNVQQLQNQLKISGLSVMLSIWSLSMTIKVVGKNMLVKMILSKQQAQKTRNLIIQKLNILKKH